MNKKLFLILLLFLNINTLCYANESGIQTDEILNFSSYKVKSSEIIKLSNDAINKCFKNIAEGKSSKNFPDTPGPMNLEFPKEKKYEYMKIISYKYRQNNPGYVTFLIGPTHLLGHHLAVGVDLNKMEVQKVYNYPGS